MWSWVGIPGNSEIDASAFLLTGNGKVRSDEEFVFYGQPSSTFGLVTKLVGVNSILQQFQVIFNEIPTEIQKIVFSLTIYSTNQSFRQVSDIHLRILDTQTGSEIIRFMVPNIFTEETVIVVDDLYIHSGQWKFNSVGAGYFGGLAALCSSFGAEVEDEQLAAIPSIHMPKEQPITQHPPISRNQLFQASTWLK